MADHDLPPTLADLLASHPPPVRIDQPADTTSYLAGVTIPRTDGDTIRLHTIPTGLDADVASGTVRLVWADGKTHDLDWPTNNPC